MSNELETTAVETNEVHLDKKDLKRLFWRSNGVQSAFNFERMQGLGFCWGMLPVIDKLYKNKEDRVAAYKRHSGYFNTHPWMGGIIYGIVAAMEERKANGEEVDEDNIQAVKGALMGPLAGMGDSIFFSTFRPIVAGICASLALSGVSIAPLLFLIIINLVHFGVQWWGVRRGRSRRDLPRHQDAAHLHRRRSKRLSPVHVRHHPPEAPPAGSNSRSIRLRPQGQEHHGRYARHNRRRLPVRSVRHSLIFISAGGRSSSPDSLSKKLIELF